MENDIPEEHAPISTQAGRDRFRVELLAGLSPRYSPAAHLFGPTLFAAAVSAACIALLEDVRAIELTVMPALFVAANAFEWRLHHSFMHKVRGPFRLLYEQHTLMHHRLYVEEDMAIRSFKEAAFILFPWYAVPLTVVGTAPLAAALWWLASPNVGLLFWLSCMLYILSYEWLHTSFHLSPDSFIGRRRLIRFLATHHARHHNPRYMARWNMNVVFPLWDYVRRSTLRSPGTEQTRAEVG